MSVPNAHEVKFFGLNTASNMSTLKAKKKPGNVCDNNSLNVRFGGNDIADDMLNPIVSS